MSETTSAFHAVSAFNNAGFALFSDNLMSFVADPWIILPICAAIILIGCAVWWQSRRARQRREAAGFDPVQMARRTGVGVRAEPDPASADAS